MATTIKLKRTGNESVAVETTDAEGLVYAEPAWCSLNKKLFVGTGSTAFGVFYGNGDDPAYSQSNHNHDSDYAAANHNHDSAYQATLGDNDIKDSHIDWGESTGQVSTTDIPEGTNLFYTDARADARIAAASLTAHSDVNPALAGDDGKVLSYDHSNADFTWVAAPGNTDENVSTANLLDKLALLDNSEDIVIGDAADTTVVIAGDLTVQGTTTTVTSENLAITDKIIHIAKGVANSLLLGEGGIAIGGTDQNSPISGMIYLNSTSIGGASNGRAIRFEDSLVVLGNAAGNQAGVAIVELQGANGTKLYSKVGGAAATPVIQNATWVGDDLTESQITGAQFSNWNTAYTERNNWSGGVIGDGSPATLDGALSALGIGPGNQSKFGTIAGTVAQGNHLHTGVYAPVAHTHTADDITGGEVDGGTF